MGCSTKSIGDVELAVAEIGCSTKSIGVVGVAVAEMACSRKSIGDVGAAVVADAHGKTLQAEGDNDVLQSSGKICEDVVLGEVVSRLCRLPWNERPLLTILNRTWFKVMTERFPVYDVAFHNRPNIQSNALILSHIKRTPGEEASYRLEGLWVCRPDNNSANIGEGVITVRLPEHPVVKVHKYTKFVCDNHRVFSLTPSVVTKEPEVRQNIYNVWMLDLRDFNIHWKRLPPLPRLWDYVYALSSLNGDGSSYIWQQTHSDSSEAEGWKLGALRKGEDKEMNSLNCEWHWEYVNVNTRPPRNLNFDIMSQRLPLYVEIQLLHEFFVNDAIVMKRLYMRCPIPDYTLNKSDYSYIFVLPDGNISRISECSLCSITVGGGGIWTQKVGLDEERTRIVEEHEWNDFVEYWNDEMRRQRKWRVPSRERSAIIVFRWYNQWCLKQKVELTEKKTHNKVVNEHSTIRVAKTGLYRDIHTWVQGLRELRNISQTASDKMV